MKQVYSVLPICLALLSGCFGSSAATRFHMLSSSSVPELTQSETAIRVAVGPVTVAEYLSRDELIVRGADHTVKVLDFDHWIEPLERAIPRVLADKMEVELKQAHALVYPAPASHDADFQIQVEIERFDASEADQTVLVALWSVRSKSGQQIVSRQRTVLSRSAESDDKAAVVRSLNGLINELAQAISIKIMPMLDGRK